MSGAQPEIEPILSLFEIDETRYSSLTKLLRVTTHASRLIRNVKNKTPTNEYVKEFKVTKSMKPKRNGSCTYKENTI